MIIETIILEYPIKLIGTTRIEVPKDSMILCARKTNNKIIVYVECPCTDIEEYSTLAFKVVGTMEVIDTQGYIYTDTIIDYNNSAHHIFMIKE